MIRISTYLLALIVAAALFTACNKEKTTILTISNISIYGEGPLFEGANTAQGEVLNKLDAFAKENGIAITDIKTARLKSMSLSVSDTSNFDLYSSLSIQFASDKTDMIQAAAINKVTAGSKKLDLTLSGEQKDLIEVLKQDKFTMVVDAIIASDTNTNINMISNMEIELKY